VILVLGMSSGGAESLPQNLLARIADADVLIGGKRHLGYFADFGRECLSIGADVQPIVERLKLALNRGEKAVVLASGDPLCYGIGATLRRYFEPDQLEIIPAPSAFQLAFAALAEPWQDAAFLSAHARPLEDVIQGVLSAPKAAILTDNTYTPPIIAGALIAAGLPTHTQAAVCENLGAASARILRARLGEMLNRQYAPLNVMVVWQDAPPPRPIPPGLADSAFSTSGGQITKRAVRLLSLAELALEPGQVLWDIGAGSGAVAIEAARSQPTAQVYAIEKRPAFCDHLRENLRRFPAPNLTLTEGIAPAACSTWAAPHAVFIGGSGGRLAAIIELVKTRLHPGGRVVANLVTLENLQEISALLPESRALQIQVNYAVPIQAMRRLEALNPVFMVTWRRDE